MSGIEPFCGAVSAVLERDGLLISPADWMILSRWYQEGTPPELAVETIQRIRERTGVPRHLAYYSPAVDEARQDLAEMQVTGARTGEEPCDAFTLFATAGRPCLSCGFAEDDHDTTHPRGGDHGEEAQHL
jgi:hypothetical protein